MIRINRSLLATAVLSVLSTGVNAKIYPDQIVHDQLGDDVCRSGYRPLDRFEAEEQKSALLARMGTWQITGLKGNWVIMGPGYNGLIKQDTTNGKTFCYPNNDQSEIPNYSAKSVPEGSELDVQYELVNNRNDFVRPLSYLAHNLGYAWVGGNNSQYVGEDMTINRSGDSWVIQGNNGGSCSGYRCGEKTKITVDNFAYTVNDDNFWHGDVVESDRELVKTVYATARNNSNIAQQVVVDLKVDESTNWSKTNSYGFSQSVQTENTFKWPLVGETKLTIKFEANQSFSKSNGGSTSEQVTLQARPMVPANSGFRFESSCIVQASPTRIDSTPTLATMLSLTASYVGVATHGIHIQTIALTKPTPSLWVAAVINLLTFATNGITDTFQVKPNGGTGAGQLKKRAYLACNTQQAEAYVPSTLTYRVISTQTLNLQAPLRLAKQHRLPTIYAAKEALIPSTKRLSALAILKSLPTSMLMS